MECDCIRRVDEEVSPATEWTGQVTAVRPSSCGLYAVLIAHGELANGKVLDWWISPVESIGECPPPAGFAFLAPSSASPDVKVPWSRPAAVRWERCIDTASPVCFDRQYNRLLRGMQIPRKKEAALTRQLPKATTSAHRQPAEATYESMTG